MRILCIGDLHGRMPKIHFKDFDAIICIGDVCSDEDFGPYWKLWFKLVKELGEDSPKAQELMLSGLGEMGVKRLEKKSLREGRKIMEYLNSFGKPVFFIPGNWDQSEGKSGIKNPSTDNYNSFKSALDSWLGDKINPLLIKGLKNIKDCQFKLQKYQGYDIIGYGLSNTYENPKLRKNLKKIPKQKLSRLKKSYNKLINKLEDTYNKRNGKAPTIFLTHNVPYKSKLDILNNKESFAHNKNMGSTVARKFCDKHQPLLCIGGHMHEHFGKKKLQKTTIINVGFGSYVNTLIELDKGKIKKIKFWDGKNKYKIKK